MKRIIEHLILLIAATAIFGSCSKQPKSVLLDTDWWTDVDDALAIRLLANLQDDGALVLEGVNLSAYDSTSVETISKFLEYSGLGEVPLSVDKLACDYPGHPRYRQVILSDTTVTARHHSIDDCEDCVDYYRRILSETRGKVDIISIGFPNALARLLESGPDSYSKLDGRALILKKVNHLWMMGGQYPEGREHNFWRTQRSRDASELVCTQWPTPITFLGFEVGLPVFSGSQLPRKDLLSKILFAHGSGAGRNSWDPMTVLLAAQGSPEAAGYDYVQGTVVVDPDYGDNTFEPSPEGPHRYVVMKEDPSYYRAVLDTLLMPRR